MDRVNELPLKLLGIPNNGRNEKKIKNPKLLIMKRKKKRNSFHFSIRFTLFLEKRRLLVKKK